jgi:hypothetical protein
MQNKQNITVNKVSFLRDMGETVIPYFLLSVELFLLIVEENLPVDEVFRALKRGNMHNPVCRTREKPLCLFHVTNKIFTFLSILIAMSLFKVNAQVSVSGGVKMEAGIHQFWLYDLDDYTSKTKIAPGLGCFLEIELNDKLAIQPEMMFSFKNSEIRHGNRNDDFQQWGMILPVYLVGREYIDNGMWYFGLGAYAGFGFNARMKNAKTALYKEVEGRAIMNRWDYGISTMLGYEYSNGIQINTGLYLGLNDQLDAGKKDATVINKVITVGVGYHF